MKNVSIFAGHDANIAFADTDNDTYHVIEIERLVKKRYFRLHVDNSMEDIYAILSACQNVAKQYFGMDDEYDVFSMPADGGLIPLDLIQQIFPFKEMTTFDHHRCHAASTFYQSPFKESLILSYDGGGDDGYFNLYVGNQKGVHHMKKWDNHDFGGGYLLCGSVIREVAEKSSNILAFSGKLMGLCGYGKPIEGMTDSFKDLFLKRNYSKIIDSINIPVEKDEETITKIRRKAILNPWENPLGNWLYEGKKAYDIAATAQAEFFQYS